MPPSGKHSNWLEIDRSAIAHNTRLFRDRTGVEVMAVVKANGYGHGTAAVARAALRGGATWCGVARIEEAIELRRAGIDAAILVLGATAPGRVQEAIGEGISMAVWGIDQVQAAAAAANGTNERARLHLKVDTGMTRLGIAAEDAADLAGRIAAEPRVRLEGVFTHFARADEGSSAPTDLQEQGFVAVLKALEARGLDPGIVHAANSAASLTRPSSHFDLLRVGIALYGLNPSMECAVPEGFRPALTWKAQLTQVRPTPPGRGVSYGHAYVTGKTERIGVVPVGYGDGYRRVSGNTVLVAGREVPVVGRVCMDQIMIQLDQVPDARAGDEVVLVGEQGQARISVDDLARRWGTFNYEVVCGLSARIPRVYRG
jgi:alanine racemase